MQEVELDETFVELLAKEVFTTEYSGPTGLDRESSAEDIGTILDGLATSD